MSIRRLAIFGILSLLFLLMLATVASAEDAHACNGLMKALEKVPPDSPGYAKVLELAQTNCGEAADHAALIDLYHSTNGDNWTNNTGWLDETVSHCDWLFVDCDISGRVSFLTLHKNNLTGYVTDSLGNLSSLQGLNLSANFQLSGSLPDSLGNLSNLEWLVLVATRLTGPIL